MRAIVTCQHRSPHLINYLTTTFLTSSDNSPHLSAQTPHLPRLFTSPLWGKDHTFSRNPQHHRHNSPHRRAVKYLISIASPFPVGCSLVYVLDKNRPQGCETCLKNQGRSCQDACASHQKVRLQPAVGAIFVAAWVKKRWICAAKGEVFCVALPERCHCPIRRSFKGEVFCAVAASRWHTWKRARRRSEGLWRSA